MGQGTSRAASATSRSYQAVEATAAAAHSVPAAAGSAVASDAQRAAAAAAAALRTTPTLAEEEELEAQDEQLGSLLDRLGGSVHGRAVAIGPNEGPAPATTTGAGRLPPSALRELFELQRAAAGGAVDVERLLAKHGADPVLVRRVLSQVCLPQLVQAAGPSGVQAFAEWPQWFPRRSSSSSRSSSKQQ